MTKDEVKTPLSFLFKILPWLVAALIVILYSPTSDDMKWLILRFVFISILILALAVLIFAWFRPTHLVYGESGHRAERKMEFGTETRIITSEELERLPATSDPRKPLIEKK